jgi:hypothetical protein
MQTHMRTELKTGELPRVTSAARAVTGHGRPCGCVLCVIAAWALQREVISKAGARMILRFLEQYKGWPGGPEVTELVMNRVESDGRCERLGWRWLSRRKKAHQDDRRCDS